MSSENTFGAINKKYWDSHAETAFAHEWVKDISRQISENLQAHIDWIGINPTAATEGSKSQEKSVSLLDYACGSGMASRALFSYVSKIRGIDVSDGMVEQYNNSARNQGVAESHMYAIQGDLAAPLTEPSNPALNSDEFSSFDLIIVCMALHHIDAPERLTTQLVKRLRENGVLVIVDWTLDDEEGLRAQRPDEGSHDHGGHDHGGHGHGGHGHGGHGHGGHGNHPSAHTINYDGFSEKQMGTILRRAGCKEVGYFVLDEPAKVPTALGGQKELFFARGRK